MACCSFLILRIDGALSNAELDAFAKDTNGDVVSYEVLKTRLLQSVTDKETSLTFSFLLFILRRIFIV